MSDASTPPRSFLPTGGRTSCSASLPAPALALLAMAQLWPRSTRTRVLSHFRSFAPPHPHALTRSCTLWLGAMVGTAGIQHVSSETGNRRSCSHCCPPCLRGVSLALDCRSTCTLHSSHTLRAHRAIRAQWLSPSLDDARRSGALSAGSSQRWCADQQMLRDCSG